ncbi:RagB/SusD family nutrient uptake outer membrane protein [Spirosoma sp. KUDC1026]|uniref:RagB/SusD family nutrient uptake outer membrane protein n=1 Tax=Spirosoma sp. KUDC1026 TaxID=2745947 RepID=UPI00159BA103|nr:RagB/SusD family nutrient uptake outer membrane protein [Spirosoma sp. KUDC1026]QKZ14238.1 RagB/SusD family nutrient uptake outer membrane protein [Spirosoma sp. KUDC1026]
MIQKVKIISLALLVTSISITGCNDNFVNTQPLDQVAGDAVWSDPALTEAFVTGIYAGLGQGGFYEQQLASLTDEAIFTHPGRGITTITEARSNPADAGWINETIDWNQMYLRIRAANLAIQNLTTPKFANTSGIVDRLMGEAKFMRAYYYHQLVRYYGGVPIVDKVYGLGEADYTKARNTMEECINFITKDCDDAAALLKGKSPAKGRANELAALALKSRMLTYAASDLYDAATAKAKSSTHAAFAQPAILGYVSGSRADRWQKAKAAAKAVLDATSGYQLNLSAPATKDAGTTNYMNIALSRNGGDQDVLFSRSFINQKPEAGGQQGLFNGPNGYHNWAGNTPISLLVDDYEMMDGSKFSWSDPAKATTPYANRDPRLYASILYDGAPWKPRTADVAAKDPVNQIQTGQYEVTSGSGKVSVAGLDTRKSTVEDWNGSYTGYYMRKFIDPNPAIVDQNTYQQIPWPFFRYTEAVFNYAEACIELGEDAEARTWLNKIRFRSGMPALTETGDALRQRYRNERRIEMVFEEQRYHDARRWMIAPTTLGRKANTISITGTLKAGKTVSLYKYDPTSYDYSYRVVDIDPGKENRAWLDKMYFLPISRDEMNRNNKLVQNPGY